MRRLLALAAVAALGVSGCGDKHAYNHEAETEGEYVDVGNLVYQVQMSRYLNPGDREDAEYLQGLPAGTPPLAADETWFGVWMRVKNYSDETLNPATDIKIVDTEGKEYEPVAIKNVFTYDPKPLGADQVLPLPDTAAASGPIQGSLILFRLDDESIQNRPLVLHIEQPGTEGSEISLDL